MAYFHYKLVAREGQVRGGVIHLPFDNPLSAIAYLERQGGTVIFANPLHPWLGVTWGVFERFFETRVKVATMAEALNNASIMLQGGIPVVAAIQDALADHDNPTIAMVGCDLVSRIHAGSSLSEAARKWDRHFPETTLFLMRIGEETGSLDRAIQDAARHMIKVDKIVRETRGALLYPAIMFTVIFLAMAFWLYAVVPMVLPLLKATGKELPALTQGIIATADFLRDHIGTLFLTLFGLILAFRSAMRQLPPFRRQIHALMLKLPIIETIIHASNLAFITAYFSLLLKAGVDVIKSIDILSASLSNEIYRMKMREVRAGLLNGLGLRASFAEARIFPAFVVRLIGIGEVSGALSVQLDFAAEEYGRRLDDVVKTLGKSIEPIALVLGGGLFVLLLVGMFMPLYSMAG